MHNILIVTEEKNYLLMSIREKFKNESYKITMVSADTNAINGVKEPISVVLIYADDKLAEQQQALNFLKDRAVTDDIPIFLIGGAEVLKEVKSMFPQHLVPHEFLRPINVTELVETIDSFIKQLSMHIKRKILVVDDSGSMLRNVKGWLEDKYNVILANSGAMAIKYLALNRPDLILLDYEMPVCDGRQVLEMIRAEMEFSDIPVMFLTGKGDKDTIMQVKELKLDGYLLKTMEPHMIVKAIDEFFEKRKGLM